MSERDNPIHSWFMTAYALMGWRLGRRVEKRVLEDIARRWSAHQLRTTIKFKPRLLSYR